MYMWYDRINDAVTGPTLYDYGRYEIVHKFIGPLAYGQHTYHRYVWEPVLAGPAPAS